jgi:AAA15 family ATPase/GTPase
MKIISKIEINYFRSVYSVTFSKNNDINVLIGGNDSGKSNILKALNLFFNNKTELENSFDFFDDLSRLREEQARATKGRAFLWVRITFNNFLNWKSLPDQFSVKKTWNRYTDRPVDTYPTEILQATMARFLNKISFHYIPAVRGRNIFSHYLNALHDALVEDEKAGVTEATSELMATINKSTEDMSKKIDEGLGFTSNIQIPKDLRELFSALDFSTKFSGYDIPLQKRGDGIQARHIPFILDFIARHSNRHHIWAYEEPENSLELGKAFELAEQFNTEFFQENQIFITTHSPAFYDLSGSHVTKWFVSSNQYKEETEFVTEISIVSQSELADKSLGVAALISSRAKNLYKEINELKEVTENLNKTVIAANMSQVIVEGPTDKSILDIAFTKLFPGEEPFCEFAPAGGCSNISSYIQTINKLQKKIENPVVGLFDNDSAGVKEFKKFNSYKKVDGTDFRVINKSKRIYCGVLPQPEEFNAPIFAVKQSSGLDFTIPVPIEFMFSGVVIKKAVEENILALRERIVTAQDSELSAPVNLTNIFSKHLPQEYSYLSYKIDDTSKNNFSIWVNNLPPESFEHFTPLFETLRILTRIEQNETTPNKKIKRMVSSRAIPQKVST